MLRRRENRSDEKTLDDALGPGADLRGRSFADLDLRGVSLREARCGMRGGWAATMAAAGLALSIACGAAAGAAGRVFQDLFASEDPMARALAIFAAAVLGVFLVITAWRGPMTAVRRLLPAVAAFAIIGSVVGVVSGVGTGRGGMMLLAFSLALAAIVLLASLARAVAGTAGTVFFVVAALTGAVVGSQLGGGIASTVIAIGAMLTGRRALKSDTSLRGLPRLVARVACRGGTRFRGADLRDADFRGATLAATDFRGARLEGADFGGATLELTLFDGDSPRSASKKDAHDVADPRRLGRMKPGWR